MRWARALSPIRIVLRAPLTERQKPTLKNLMLKRQLGAEENVRNETIGTEMVC